MTILEEHPYGGILHLALHGIAHNFLAEDDPATAAALRLCLSAEDQALVRLGHDFTYAVCSPLDPRADLRHFAFSTGEFTGESDPRRASDPMTDPR